MPPESKCLFTKVMDYNFLVFLYLATIVFPALLMGAFYAHIYSIVRKQLKQIVTVNGMGGGSMLRVLGAARKRDVKAIKNLSIIVLFFIICWFPLYTINFVQAFCLACEVPPLAMDSCIILSHLNSAGNPLLYAYHLTDFRSALRSLLFGTPPDQKQCQQSLTQTTPTPIVYKVPNTTPRMPHKIFDFDTTVAKNCSGNGAEMCISAVAAAAAVVASTERESDEALCRYTALLASTPRWGSLDSSTDWPNEHQRSYHYHAHSSPPSPTKPHVILDPT
ncbi:hypothetical protein O3M35_012785 [Rhynocoris fuscipes]|uniref:G-protein coupled receptors family 1 profile domain-containing protein n=1 Tax=Rhynocoris fuscipes TaxID=488301 RepID=A0AAW1CGF1_9HEMI